MPAFSATAVFVTVALVFVTASCHDRSDTDRQPGRAPVLTATDDSDAVSASEYQQRIACDKPFSVYSLSKALRAEACRLASLAVDTVGRDRAVAPGDTALILGALIVRGNFSDSTRRATLRYAEVGLALRGKDYSLSVRFDNNDRVVGIGRSEPLNLPR